MITNKYGQKVFTIEELDAMGLPEDAPFETERIKELMEWKKSCEKKKKELLAKMNF
jgi:hypothetical protein